MVIDNYGDVLLLADFAIIGIELGYSHSSRRTGFHLLLNYLQPRSQGGQALHLTFLNLKNQFGSALPKIFPNLSQYQCG